MVALLLDVFVSCCVAYVAKDCTLTDYFVLLVLWGLGGLLHHTWVAALESVLLYVTCVLFYMMTTNLE